MDKKRQTLAGYRFVGTSGHSAVKICRWTRIALRGKGFCYKQQFYGIESHRCMQISPAVPFCTHNCAYCWRIGEHVAEWSGPVDDPNEILDGCIAQQRLLLSGFGGHPIGKRLLREAERPRHVAISLDGEPLLYPKINELIQEVLRRQMTAFVVTNGTLPDVLEKLVEPTQLYITLPAPNEKTYIRTCAPMIADGWERIQKSLALLQNFSCNTVIRLTLVRDLNLVHPEEYAKIIDDANPRFVEVKAAMAVGGFRDRLPYEAMPRHEEIKEFAKKIAEKSGYEIKDEKTDSRVVLLE